MKNILYHTLSLLFASLFFVACTQESVLVSFEKEGDVTLTLRLSSGDLQSRAEAGNDAYNENAITKVDLYLYPAGGTGVALLKVSETFTREKNEVTLTTTLTNAEKDALFPNGNVCHAYALVNYPGTAPSEKTDTSTIANLKALEITTDFTKTQSSFVMDGESDAIAYNEDTKVVTGEVQVKRAASKIGFFVTGVDKTITDDAGNTWIPNYDEMKVSFHNGVNKAKVDVGYTTEDRPNNTLSAGSYYATSGNRNIGIIKATENTDTYSLETTHAPFYSYSSDWGRAENPDTEPTITLMVPWMKIKDAEGKNIANPDWQTCYYQIPVNVKSIDGSLADCMERNMYYKISFHVGILGDFNPATPTIITASYYTVDWVTQNVDVDIKNYKYLVVDKNDVTVYNENEVRIGYASSDTIKAEITYIRRPDYSDAKTDTTVFYGSVQNQSGRTDVDGELMNICSVAIEGNEIVLRHNLKNKSSDDDTSYDYVPYYIWIKVVMTVKVNDSEKTFTEWIRYEQYPAIYVKAHLNSDYDADATNRNPNKNGGWVDTDNDQNGYVYVNGYQGSSYSYNYSYNGRQDYHSWPKAWVLNYDKQQYLGSANGMSSNAGNKNPNMYVIYVSALPEGSSYIIGDPRVKSIDEDLRDAKFTEGDQDGNSIWVEANDISGIKRLLTYPYPTDASMISSSATDADDYKTGMMIAPKIRVASSYSVLSTTFVNQKEIARRRCASYQEDGYPAGRWRLPTYAEGEFIVRLSSEGKIPILFSKDSYYWCAHGYFDPATGTNNDGDVEYYNSSSRDGGASVRCVYDEWYWGSDPIANKTTFTWGDAPRN